MRVAPYVAVLLLLWTGDASAQLPHNIPDVCQNSPDTIKPNETVTWSGSQIKGCVGVKGTLILPPGSALAYDTILVYPNGFLDVQCGAIVTRRNLPLAANDPEQYSGGVLVMGRLRAICPAKLPFTRIASEPRAGHTTVALSEAPTGWAVGDRVMVPGTNQLWPASVEYRFEWEERTVTAINGATVSLNAPLTYDHLGARDHTGTVRYLPHIANLSRGTVFRSEAPTGVRGHLLFSGDAQVDLQYIRVEHMGRTTTDPVGPTNVKGRYPVHLHMPNTASHLNAVGNVVEGSPKWGIFVHSADDNVVRDNVVYNVGGAGIGTEDGDESGNIFDRNFAAVVWGTGGDRADERLGINDYAYEGSPFWFRSPNNTITRNVGANSNSYCVSFFMINGTGDAESTPFGTIDGNECYSTFFGWTIWHYLARCGVDVFEGPEVPIRNTVQWHIGKMGYYGYCSNRLTFDGWTQFNQTTWNHNPSESHRSFYFGDYIASNTKILNANVFGPKIGIVAPYKVGDQRNIYGGAVGTILVENSQFRVDRPVIFETPYGVVGGGPNLTPRLMRLRNVGVTSAVAEMIHTTDGYPGLNWTVSDRLLLENAGGLTGEAYRQIQSTQNFYGGVAPADAVANPAILGLFSGTGSQLPPTDSDGDGVPDASDKCPGTAPGTKVDAAGCPIPPGPQPSPDGTCGITVTDSTLAVWTHGTTQTFGEYPVFRDGVFMNAGTTQFCYFGGSVYIQSASGAWQRWSGSAWVPSADPRPPQNPCTANPVVPPLVIRDTNGALLTWLSGSIQVRNSAGCTVTASP